MKFKVKIKHGRLYISKGILVVLFSLAFLVLVVSGIFLGLFFKPFHAQEQQETRLGVAPTEALAIKDSKQAQEYMVKKIENEHKNKLTIIFFYDGFKSEKEAIPVFNLFKSVISQVQPYKDAQNLFKFHLLTSEGKACHVEKEILLCDQHAVEGLGRLGIDRMKVVIFSPEKFTSQVYHRRGALSYMTISAHQEDETNEVHNNRLKFLFAHELGESLGLFPEGVSDSVSQISFNDLQGRPNCAPDLKTAQKWWQAYATIYKEVGYFQGCMGKPDYYYPQKNTLMSQTSQESTYGRVSEDYLRGVISCFYGGKDSYSMNGKTQSCAEFKKEYPEFWKE